MLDKIRQILGIEKSDCSVNKNSGTNKVSDVEISFSDYKPYTDADLGLTIEKSKKPTIETQWKNEKRTVYGEPSPFPIKEDEGGNILIKIPENGGEWVSIKDYHDFSIPLWGTSVKNIDFSKHPELLSKIQYDEKTIDSSCTLPQNYDTRKVIESGKNPGLNVREMHKMGITGKGQKIAILDWQLNPHNEYDDRIKCYEVMPNAEKVRETFHGSTVTSIAAGKNTGVAKDSDIFYFAVNGTDTDGKEIGQSHKAALKRILEINQKLPKDKRIKIVSVSAPIYGGEEAADLVDKLEKSGCHVLSSDRCFDNFGYLKKKDPTGNPDDFNNYEPEHFGRAGENALFVNSGDRTVASSLDNSNYRHDSIASQSWTVPYVAGLYTNALQIDKDLSFEDFVYAADKTARKITIPRNDKSARERILAYGSIEIKKDICNQLYPNYPFNRLDTDREKLNEVMNEYNNKYWKNNEKGELVCDSERLEADSIKRASAYIKELQEKGIIDKDLNYTSNKLQIKIVDAKALAEYLQNRKN